MSFSEDIARHNKKALDAVEKIRKATILDLFGNVILMSPVDTGMFRGNWRTATGSPNGQNIDKVRSPAQVELEIKLNIGVLGNVTFFSNSLPYALPLENGSSKQAPAGMVAIQVARFESVVAKHVARNRV